MLADLVPYLRCPACHRRLAAATGALRCERGHGFDLARAGYVNLTTGAGVTHPGDTARMVAARVEFLGSGSYDFLSTALSAAASGHLRSGGLVVDAGGGTGYHLARVLAAAPAARGLTLDVSKPALRRAARAHPRAGAVLADTWRALPLADRAAAAVLNVFAPRNGAELHRILAPDGRLLVVTPTAAHLAELAPILPGLRLLAVDPAKPDQLAASLAGWFDPAGTEAYTHRLRLSRGLVRALVGMGPSAPHIDPAELDRAVAGLPEPLPVTAAVRLTRYAPR